jgi:uncharacterized cupin superfamily protein
MATTTGYTLMHRDEFERSGKWSLARRSLGLQSFGMNVVDLQPGERIPEHDETGRDQEEVFIVLSGAPSFVVDGDELPASAGTFIRLDPHPRRTIINNSDQPASILLTSAPRSSGYEPMDWA